MAVQGENLRQKSNGYAPVAIIIVPRENFRSAVRSLSRLIEVTEHPYQLIYIDDGAPRPVRRTLRDMVRSRNGTYLSSSHMLKPNSARILGLEQAHTPFVVLLDNDVLLAPGWLSKLVTCAEQHQAAYVSPVILVHETSPYRVHFAGGVNRIALHDGRCRFVEEYYLMHGGTIDDIESKAGAIETTLAEFHLVLLRRTVLEEAGGLSEGCSTAFEHNDLCLSIAAVGGVGWLEQGTLVDWMEDYDTPCADCRRTMLRWSKSWIDESLAAFATKWNLDPGDQGFEASLQSLHTRRFKPFRGVLDWVRRLAGDGGVAVVSKLIDLYIENVLVSRHRHAVPRLNVQRYIE